MRGFKIFLIMLLVLTILTVGSILLIQHYNEVNVEVPTDKVEHTCEFNGDWVVEKEPTCYLEGLKYQLCECGERQEETISMSEHNMSEWVVEVEPTTETEGLITRHCLTENCDYVESQVVPVLEQDVSDFVFTPINIGNTITTEGAEDHVAYMIGDGTRNNSNGYLGTETEIVVPAVYNGLPVKIIGDSAFKNNTSITSIKFSEGIEQIYDYSLSLCTSLRVVELPSTLKYINGLTFNRCSIDKFIVADGCELYSTLDDGNLLTDVHQQDVLKFASFEMIEYSIPEGIRAIQPYAFNVENSALIKLELPNTLTEIFDNAFSYNRNLVEITLPANVSYVDSSAFRSCNALTKLTILNGGSVIEYFNLPGSITEIEVNNALVESYKIADGWSAYADMIKIHSYFNGTFELTFECEGISETHLLESNVNTPSTEEEWPIKLDGVNCGGGFNNSCQLRIDMEELHFDLSYDEQNKQYIGYLWADSNFTELIAEVQITKIS